MLADTEAGSASPYLPRTLPDFASPHIHYKHIIITSSKQPIRNGARQQAARQCRPNGRRHHQHPARTLPRCLDVTLTK
jgi:hypothetical protein